MEQADLVVLVPDSHWRAVIEAIIPRHRALGTRPIVMKEPIVQSRRDPGVRSEGPAMLRLHARTTQHALLILDFEGSGARGSAEGLRGDLQQRLDEDWNGQALALVVEPELEAWLWGASDHLPAVIERPDAPRPSDWARTQGRLGRGVAKPDRPKEVLEAWLKAHRDAPSASIWRGLAMRASLDPTRCQQPSFQRFVRTLREWFPPPPP